MNIWRHINSSVWSEHIILVLCRRSSLSVVQQAWHALPALVPPPTLHTLSLARVHLNLRVHPKPGAGLCQSEARRTASSQWDGGRLTLPCSWQNGGRPVGDPCFEGVVMRLLPAKEELGWVENWLPEWILASTSWLTQMATLWFTNPSIVDCGINSQVNREHRSDFWKSLGSVGLQILFRCDALTHTCKLVTLKYWTKI